MAAISDTHGEEKICPGSGGGDLEGGEDPPVEELKEETVDGTAETVIVSAYPEELQTIIESVFKAIGLEVHPFLVGWYNDKVDARFSLAYPAETLAFVVISGPDMFEKCIVPYANLMTAEDPHFSTSDALDDSMRHAFGILQEDLASEGLETDIFHDFDLYPSRRPKVLVQTAAHVAGAVQYLHKNCLPKEIQEKQFSEKSNLSGVAIHPKYGGWFAIRGVIVFTNVHLPEGGKEVDKPEPLQILTDIQVIAKVIELFAYNWQTNEWRDIYKGGTENGVRYSPEFIQFLELSPAQRWDFVKTISARDNSVAAQLNPEQSDQLSVENLEKS